MNPRRFLLLLILVAASGWSRAQNLTAKLFLQNEETWDVTVFPRSPNTTSIQVERADRQGRITQVLNTVRRIEFDLEALNPSAIVQAYHNKDYAAVIEGLKGRIVPYYAFVDTDANSNLLISYFTRSLYFTDNADGVLASAREIQKYAASGKMRLEADVYRTLALWKKNRPQEFRQALAKLPSPDPQGDLVGAVAIAKVRASLLSNDWARAYPMLADLITSRPMDPEWNGEALFLSATWHHSRTNLVVANQICQEITTVDQGSPWAKQATDLAIVVAEQAGTLGIALVEAGARRDGKKEAGEAKIDYKERQRALQAEAAEKIKQELKKP
jgi:hypothetical protein